jgi:hypothetical protein
MKILELLLTVLLVPFIPFFYLLIHIMILVDKVAYWLDRRFHTQFRTPEITQEEVECLIETYIQPDSTNEEILFFLKLFNLRHSEPRSIVDDEFWSYHAKANGFEQESERIKGTIGATVENTGKSLLVRGDIQILFYYDDQNRLVKYTTRWVGTGF